MSVQGYKEVKSFKEEQKEEKEEGRQTRHKEKFKSLRIITKQKKHTQKQTHKRKELDGHQEWVKFLKTLKADPKVG